MVPDPDCEMCEGSGEILTPAHQRGGDIVDDQYYQCVCTKNQNDNDQEDEESTDERNTGDSDDEF